MTLQALGVIVAGIGVCAFLPVVHVWRGFGLDIGGIPMADLLERRPTSFDVWALLTGQTLVKPGTSSRASCSRNNPMSVTIPTA